jgi:hypothetical protein
MSSCRIFMKRLKDAYRWLEFRRGIDRKHTLSLRDAPLGAGPESILPMVVMDSGLARYTRDLE